MKNAFTKIDAWLVAPVKLSRMGFFYWMLGAVFSVILFDTFMMAIVYRWTP